MTGHIAQDGWTITGARKTKEIPHVMTTACQYSRDTTDDPRCAGCRWKAAA